jgi:hypothetical protein
MGTELSRSFKHDNTAAALAMRYLETVDARQIGPTASLAELGACLTKPFPETGQDAEQVIHELVARC